MIEGRGPADAHWRLAIEPLVRSVRPACVGVAGCSPDLLERIARASGPAGVVLHEPPGGDEPLVICGPDDVPDVRPPVLVVTGRLDSPAGGMLARSAPGFGGLTVLAAAEFLARHPQTAAALDAVGGEEHLRAVAEELETERLALAGQIVPALDANELLRGELEQALRTLEAVRLAPGDDARLEALRRRAREAATIAVTAQQQLAQERAWIAGQVAAIAASRSWRLGHRLMRTARALTLRRDEGTDALTLVIRQLVDGSSEPRENGSTEGAR